MFLFKKPETFSELRAFRVSLDRFQWGFLFVFTIGCFVSISLAQISALAGFLTWMAHVRFTCSWKRIQFPLILPFALFAGASILSVILAVDWQVSVETLKKLLEILIFFWVLNVLRALKPKNNFLNRILIFRKNGLGNTKNKVLNNGETLALFFAGGGGLVSLYCFYLAAQQGIQLPHRVVGTFDNPISWGVILMMFCLLPGAHLIYSPRMKKIVPGLLFLILVSCLIITLAREAWLGFTVSLAGMFLFRKPVLALLAPLTFILILILMPVSVQDRLMAMTDLSQQTLKLRVFMWKGGWEIFKDYPVFGCGFKCPSIVANDYPGYEKFLQVWAGGLHNNYVQTAVELGLVGLITWMSIWVVFFWQSILRLRALSDNNPDRWIIHGSIWAVAAFLIACIFESHFYDTEVAMILFAIMALPFSIITNDPYLDGRKNKMKYSFQGLMTPIEKLGSLNTKATNR